MGGQCGCHRWDNDDDKQFIFHRQRLDELLEKLFTLHDLNCNGVLEEVELVKLNEKIAILHTGALTDRGAVRSRYSGIFRSRLDSDGQAVPFKKFRDYMLGILDELDDD